MVYRNQLSYRSWNALALGLKTEESVEKPEKLDELWTKDRQRSRRESWSQPPQRGRGVRGRGVWYIDNRPRTFRRRHTMPTSDVHQDHNYNTTNESSDYNPILEEPSCNNLTSSPEGTSHLKTNSSSDDGSQSRSYSNSHSNGSKKHELENYKVQRNKNTWEIETMDDSEQDQAYTESDSESLKDASIHDSSFDLNNKSLSMNDTNEITKLDEPYSPNDPTKKPLVINSELPKEITIKFSELTLKESTEETTIVSQSPIQENEQLILTDPRETEATSEVDPVTPVTPVTPKDEEQLPMLINLDEEDNDGSKTIPPKISQDILALDWNSYQKNLMEEELRLTMERQATQMPNPHKLDKGLKDFDSLL